MSATLSLRVETRLDELARIHGAIEELAESEDWPPDLLFQITLVLEELGTNIVNYGHDDGEAHEIEIELTSNPCSLTIDITDDGRPFDPLTDTPAPDLDSALESRRVGGLGVHLVREMMDEAHYRREADRNRLTLVKHRRRADP